MPSSSLKIVVSCRLVSLLAASPSLLVPFFFLLFYTCLLSLRHNNNTIPNTSLLLTLLPFRPEGSHAWSLWPLFFLLEWALSLSCVRYTLCPHYVEIGVGFGFSLIQKCWYPKRGIDKWEELRWMNWLINSGARGCYYIPWYPCCSSPYPEYHRPLDANSQAHLPSIVTSTILS